MADSLGLALRLDLPDAVKRVRYVYINSSNAKKEASSSERNKISEQGGGCSVQMLLPYVAMALGGQTQLQAEG